MRVFTALNDVTVSAASSTMSRLDTTNDATMPADIPANPDRMSARYVPR